MLSLSMLRSHALQSSCSGVRERSINNSLLSKNESELTHKWFYNFTMQLLMCAFVLFCSLFSLTASAAEAGDVLDSPASVHYFYNGLSYSKSDNAPFVVESAADSAPGAPGTSSAIDIWGPVSAPNSEKNSNLTQSECRIGNGTTSTTQLTYANGNPLNLPASIPSQQSDVF